MMTTIFVIFVCGNIGPANAPSRACRPYRPIYSYEHRNTYETAEECEAEAASLPSRPLTERNVIFRCAGKPVSVWTPTR
jgi:hypothetical protein